MYKFFGNEKMPSSIERFEQLLTNSLDQDTYQKPVKKPMSLVNLIENENVEGVRSHLQKNQKNISTPSIAQALLKNFNPQIADMLLNKGLSFDAWWKDGQLGFELTDAITQWLLTNPSVDANFLGAVFGEAILSVSSDASAAHKAELASFAVKLYKKDPSLCEESLEDYCVLHNCLGMKPDPTPQQWEMLQCLPQKTWECEIVDFSISDIKEMKSLLNLCKNIPLLNTVLTNSFKKANKAHQWFKNAISSPDGSLEKSVLCSVKNKTANLSSVLQSEINKYNNFKDLNLPPNLNLLLLAYQLKNSYKISQTHELEKICDVEEYKSFLHILLYSCGAKSLNILKFNHEVEREVCSAFDDLDVSRFLTQTTPNELQKFFSAFPKLVEWKDAAGNNFGHYIAISYSNNWRNNKETLKVIFKHPSLRESNPYGVSPRSLLEKQFDPLSFAPYDRKILKSETQSAGKVRTAAQKRKM